MLTVAYLANQFPSGVEPYVLDEIEELRRRGAKVIAGSVRRPDAEMGFQGDADHDREFVVLQPVRAIVALRAVRLCLRRRRRIADLLRRVILEGQESFLQRGKALLHTWLGACYAVRLENLGVEHIHVHHGYFGSWIAMVAARLLDVNYSLTLHGSDLLTHAAYLDVKLKHCRFCLTISEYNRRYILERYPTIETHKVVLARLGVDVPESTRPPAAKRRAGDLAFHLLTVGRLHVVKNHSFLVRACAELRRRGLDLECEIAGEGPERHHLEDLIFELGLAERVRLLGHVAHPQLDRLYQKADLVVLTSRSEGLPLVLMEAMARGKLVLAPAITGIPELVAAGKNGFLYEPGSAEDFITQVLAIHALESERASSRDSALPEASELDGIRSRARQQVRRYFDRGKNLESFGDLFLERTAGLGGQTLHENPLLQQI